jgi:hypothetical protein
VFDFIAGRRWVFLKQDFCPHQETRSAESTLNSAFFYKRFCHEIPDIPGNSFERVYFGIFKLPKLCHARELCFSVNLYHTGAAGTLAGTAILDGSDFLFKSEKMKQPGFSIAFILDVLAV